MSRLHRLCLVVIAFGLALPAAYADTPGKRITKCQDPQGKWHYGDNASEACAKSKITIMTDEGVTKKEIAAPPTEAELKAREERKAEEKRTQKQAEDQKKKDQLLLATYAVEDDIIYVRDRKLAQVESSIKASEETLKSLQNVLQRFEKQAADEQKGGKPASAETTRGIASTKQQIASHEAEIAARRAEQAQIRKEADADLARYRELKGGSKAADTAKKP